MRRRVPITGLAALSRLRDAVAPTWRGLASGSAGGRPVVRLDRGPSELIRNDQADIVIAGGAEAAIPPHAVASYANVKALCERNDDPPTASRPYDKDRHGFVMGDGAAVLILEEWQHAKHRGAKIY